MDFSRLVIKAGNGTSNICALMEVPQIIQALDHFSIETHMVLGYFHFRKIYTMSFPKS